MSTAQVRLFDLLPAYIRLRDAEEGRPLEVLMHALQGPFNDLYDDIAAAYRGWFIETCAAWQVPYIGDLIGLDLGAEATAWLPSLRSRVANTIAYRRAKGTAVALERVAADGTGWPCHVSVARPRLARTPSMGFTRSTPATVDVRTLGRKDPLGGPWSTTTRTVAVGPSRERPCFGGIDRFNLRDVGVTFWRVHNCPVHRGQLRQRLASSGWLTEYTFHPLGFDSPLFTQPDRPDDVLYKTTSMDVPRVLDAADLAVYAAPSTDRRVRSRALEVYVRQEEGSIPERVAPERLRAARLSDDVVRHLRQRTPEQPFHKHIMVDPARGRLVIIGARPHSVFADYAYGGVMDFAGGTYPREDIRSESAPSWRAVVIGDGAVPADHRRRDVRYFSSLAEALRSWNRAGHTTFPVPPAGGHVAVPPSTGSIAIADSAIHRIAPDTKIDVRNRFLTISAYEGFRPAVDGGLVPVGSTATAPSVRAPQPSMAPSMLRLEGLWIGGTIAPAGTPKIDIRHCVVRPSSRSRAAKASAAIDARDGGGGLEIEIALSICGPIHLPEGGWLHLEDSVVQGLSSAIDGCASGAYGSRLTAERVTILGSVTCGELEAADTIFDGHVDVARFEAESVRHSVFPSDSLSRHATTVSDQAPVFLSVRYGDPGYARLAPNSAKTIAQGGTDGREMGAYCRVHEGKRLANLESIFRAYLPPTQRARVAFET